MKMSTMSTLYHRDSEFDLQLLSGAMRRGRLERDLQRLADVLSIAGPAHASPGSVVMSRQKHPTAGAALLSFLAWASPASTAVPTPERPPTRCAPDSPERRGEEGCTILASRPLVGSRATPLYWHIDRYDSLDAARKAAPPG